MYKICPSCGDEFVPHIALCPDCRVPLKTAEEMANARISQGQSDVPASASFAIASAVMLRRGAASDLRELCEHLAERGLRFVIDTDPPGQRLAAPARAAATGREVQLAIYVEETDAAEASLAEQEWLLATVPGAAAGPAGGMIDACPGCSEPLSASATACASCGLEFPPLEVACPQCHGGVAPESESCPHCGYRP
jgi:hypothetical protein